MISEDVSFITGYKDANKMNDLLKKYKACFTECHRQIKSLKKYDQNYVPHYWSTFCL